MLTTVHLLFGGTIGKLFSSWWAIIPLAFFSHYILDFIPHYSQHAPKGFKKGGFKGAKKKDLFLKGIIPFFGLILFGFLVSQNKENMFNILLGSFFGFLPDALCFITWEKDWNWAKKVLPRRGTRLYNEMQNYKGVLLQIIFFTIGMTLFLIL